MVSFNCSNPVSLCWKTQSYHCEIGCRLSTRKGLWTNDTRWSLPCYNATCHTSYSKNANELIPIMTMQKSFIVFSTGLAEACRCDTVGWLIKLPPVAYCFVWMSWCTHGSWQLWNTISGAARPAWCLYATHNEVRSALARVLFMTHQICLVAAATWYKCSDCHVQVCCCTCNTILQYCSQKSACSSTSSCVINSQICITSRWGLVYDIQQLARYTSWLSGPASEKLKLSTPGLAASRWGLRCVGHRLRSLGATRLLSDSGDCPR